MAWYYNQRRLKKDTSHLSRWSKLIFAHKQVDSYLLELLYTNKY